MERDGNLREIRPHGTLLFPVCVHETRVEEDAPFPLYYHWHSEVEFLYLTEGSAVFMVEREQIQLREGDVLFIRPDVLHGSMDRNHCAPTFRALDFDPAFLSGIANDAIQQKYLSPMFFGSLPHYRFLGRDSEDGKRMYALLTQIHAIFTEDRDGGELLIKSMIYEMLYHLYRNIKNDGEKGYIPDVRKSEFIRKIVEYVQDNYENPIPLKEIAGHLAVSEGYFCRSFKENFHMTFGNYLNDVRMGEAEKLVRETDLTMEEIARKTGFNNSNYFTVCFKRMYYDTPLHYRKVHDIRKISQDDQWKTMRQKECGGE
ncbi:MAG: AraC family transcriptional regulator [Lachnospiraceae bacterium]|nr:AraC family transcriptional regulator [Candidatus Fimimorpha excrementavium]